MTNPFFSNTIDLLPATKARAGDVEANLTAVEAGFDEAKQYFDRTLRGARANPAISEIPDASTRANKALTFDGSGNPVATVTTTEISNALTYANNAQNSATAALNSANDAAGSAASAATLLDAFDDRYLGSKSSDPTLDNDGNALLTGALYWNTVSNLIRVYSGTAWQDLQQASAFFTQAFSGNGSTTAFTLSSAPASSAAVEVFITGVRQTPTTNYTVSGTTLTFVVAPPTGTSNIFVRWISVQTMVNGALTGDLSFTGTALRIRGDFSNATVANRLMLQTSTVNDATRVGFLPNGTSTASQLILFNSSSDPANAGLGTIRMNHGDFLIAADRNGAGAYLPMTFAIGGANRMIIDTSGNVGVGTTSMAYKLVVSNGGASGIEFGPAYSGTANLIQSYNRSGGAYVRQVYDASDHQFNIAGSPKVALDASGNLLVTGSGGLGYGTGSGGTVTQATSKTTAVTLNKPTGQITMNNAALGAGASAAFQLNNTLIEADDTLVVSLNATFSINNYRVTASVGSSAAIIRVENISAGSLSEAILINFSVLKGATS